MDTIIKDPGAVLGLGRKLLSKKQTAETFGVSYRTIERWHNTGYINYIRIGGRVFISYSEVFRIRDQFIESVPAMPLVNPLDELLTRPANAQNYCYGARR